LLKSFKTVLDEERAAEKLLMEAKEQADKLKREAKEKAEEIYRKTYQKAIDQAKRKTIEIKEQARVDAERDAQIFLKRAEKQKKKILEDTEEKFSEAVNAVLDEILT
jgi:vacuolar-type H+-ATPase subunit H